MARPTPDPFDPTPGPLTEADFWAWAPLEDGRRRELCDGVEVTTAGPTLEHQRISKRLFLRLHAFVDERGLGEVLYAPAPVRLSERTVLLPDLVFLAAEQADQADERQFHGGPALVVEVLSPSTRSHDEVRKLRLFDRHGVGEYWIVDPEIRAVRVYRRDAERLSFSTQRSAASGEHLESPAFPGLRLAVAELFGS